MKDLEDYKILGVDPGTNVLGYSVISIQNKEIVILEIGEIKMDHLRSHHFKLERIFSKLSAISRRIQPNAMAIEAPFYGKNVQSMLKLGRAQGVAIAAGISTGLTVAEYAPKKIKLSITGNGNASKQQVAGMLSNLVKSKLENLGTDATDALAVAVCHYYQSNGLFTSGSKYKDWAAYAKENEGKIR